MLLYARFTHASGSRQTLVDWDIHSKRHFQRLYVLHSNLIIVIDMEWTWQLWDSPLARAGLFRTRVLRSHTTTHALDLVKIPVSSHFPFEPNFVCKICSSSGLSVNLQSLIIYKTVIYLLVGSFLSSASFLFNASLLVGSSSSRARFTALIVRRFDGLLTLSGYHQVVFFYPIRASRVSLVVFRFGFTSSKFTKCFFRALDVLRDQAKPFRSCPETFSLCMALETFHPNFRFTHWNNYPVPASLWSAHILFVFPRTMQIPFHQTMHVLSSTYP